MKRDALQETVLAVEVLKNGEWTVRFSNPPFTPAEAAHTAECWRYDGFTARVVEYRRVVPADSPQVVVSLHTREPRAGAPGSEVSYPGYARQLATIR